MRKVRYINLLFLAISICACGVQEKAPVEYGPGISSLSSKSSNNNNNKISSKSFDISENNNIIDDGETSENPHENYLHEKNKITISNDHDLDNELNSLNENREQLKKEHKENKPVNDATSTKNLKSEMDEDHANPLPLSVTEQPKFLMPVHGKIITKFGEFFNGSKLNGINIEAILGSSVIAVEGGNVIHVGEDNKFGKIIIIKLNDKDVQTAYAYLEKTNVQKGEIVQKGDEIGTVGKEPNSGKSMLHFAIREGKLLVDPEKYLK